jgi:hypothetical protein
MLSNAHPVRCLLRPLDCGARGIRSLGMPFPEQLLRDRDYTDQKTNAKMTKGASEAEEGKRFLTL